MYCIMAAGGLMRLIAYDSQDIYFDDSSNTKRTEKKTKKNPTISRKKLKIYSKLSHTHATKLEYCSICCENIELNDTIHTTVCKHVFHHKCLSNYVKSLYQLRYNCPLCRHEIQLKRKK